MTKSFKLVDVFGTAPFTGNPLAVVADAEGLSTDDMQRITRWLNLSETTFLLPPTETLADYRVRIFTLARELPFAGHPTLGTCHAWLEAGGTPKRAGVIVQECGIGLVEVRHDDNRLAFAAPPLIRSGMPTEVEILEVADLLRIDRAAIVDAQWVDNGPGWIAVMLATAADVLAVEPARHHSRRIDIGIVGPHPAGSDAAFEIRAIFSDAHGALIEDPVCGSLNAGRDGRIDVAQDGNGQVWVGGRTTTMFDGQVRRER